jgi:hypothetical protein
VGCIQTHGSLANWHPHIHVIATDGGFRADGTFVPWPSHDTASSRRRFAAQCSGSSRGAGCSIARTRKRYSAGPTRGFTSRCRARARWRGGLALRLARYCARNPVALERLEYDASVRQVRHRSDKADGPTAGTETVDPLEFLARVTAHIPNKHQVMTRYHGYYANRVRGARRRRGAVTDERRPVAEPVPLALREARRRWAELLRLPNLRHRDADRRVHYRARCD